MSKIFTQCKRNIVAIETNKLWKGWKDQEEKEKEPINQNWKAIIQ
jgi:hypothetical protein